MTDVAVALRFRLESARLLNMTGMKATYCVLSLDVARRAAREHREARSVGPMFQTWDATVHFFVDASAAPDTLIVYARKPL